MIVFRIVKGNPPTEEDFKSNAAKGLQARGPELASPAVYQSISVYSEWADVVARQRNLPQLGGYIAEVDLPEATDAFRFLDQDPEPRTSHRSLIGDPAAILQRVTRVIRCEILPD